MARRSSDMDLHVGRPRRSGWINIAILVALIAAFVVVPLVITHSIVYLRPEQALGILSVIGAVVVVLLPLHDRPVKTRLFYYLLLLYLVTYICWPNWLAINLPFLPFITPSRVFLISLLVMWVFVVASSRPIHDRLWARLKPLGPVWIGLLVLLIFRALSIPFSPDPGAATGSVLEIVTMLYLPLLIAVTVIESERDVLLILKTLVVVAFVIGLTVVWEVNIQQNPFTTYFGSLVTYDARWLDKVFAGARRAGSFRAHGPFVVHLAMSEFYVTMIPFMLCWFESTKKAWLKVFLVGALALAVFAVKATGSRTGLVSCMGVFGFYFAIRGALFSVRNGSSDLRPLVSLAFLVMAMLVPLILVYQVKHMSWYAAFGARGTRTIQLNLGIPKILQRPIIGYGSGLSGAVLDYRSNGKDLTIDNYFLSIALDTGLIGFFAWVTALCGILYTSFKNAIRDTATSGIYLAFFLCFLTFTVVRTTLSDESNLSIFYTMIGVFIAFHSITLQSSALSEKTSPAPDAQRARRRKRIWRLVRTSVRG